MLVRFCPWSTRPILSKFAGVKSITNAMKNIYYFLVFLLLLTPVSPSIANPSRNGDDDMVLNQVYKRTYVYSTAGYQLQIADSGGFNFNMAINDILQWEKSCYLYLWFYVLISVIHKHPTPASNPITAFPYQPLAQSMVMNNI
jgi:hypothetical protein